MSAKPVSSVIRRLAGLVDLPEADREVLMLYSSFLRPWGQGILWSYGSQAQGIGVGITGGGVDVEGMLDPRPLNWSELQTDLLLATSTAKIYSSSAWKAAYSKNFFPCCGISIGTSPWRYLIQPLNMPRATALCFSAVVAGSSPGLAFVWPGAGHQCGDLCYSPQTIKFYPWFSRLRTFPTRRR